MKGERSRHQSFLRRKRVVIPLAAAAVLVVLGLGGYRGVVSFAMEEMTGFLVGTGSRADDAVIARPSAPAAGSSAKAATKAEISPAALRAPEVAQVEAAPAEAQPVLLAQAQPPAKPAEKKAAEAAEKTAAPPRAAATRPAPAVAAAVPGGESQPEEVRIPEKAYTASFLRDPFYSLVQAGKERPSKLLDVGDAKMVGSVWGEAGIIALLEDSNGRSYALKVGDRVQDGRVISITPASITFSITVFGLTKSVTLELAEEGE